MNKQLINKYKPEFDYWLNGGSLCIYRTDTEEFWEPTTILNWDPFTPETIVYIINDKYVEFRKALAEGKVIEYLGQSSNVWHEVQEPDFNLHPTCYRIKPDEPKFKVGDFVRYVHSTPAKVLEINNIDGNRYYFTNSEMSCLEHKLEPWTPVKGEWCWFWDKCTPHRPTLRQYDIFPEGYGEENMFHNSEQNPFDFCEPFLNSRPSYLKDK